MRTIMIPAKRPGPLPPLPRRPRMASVPPPLPQRVIWIPPREPFNPLEGASDELLDAVVDLIDTPTGPIRR